MPHDDIERFMKSLERSLGGSPKRSADIADELRDHLETHVCEAAAEGRTQGEAIARAMSEFGDAAQFAAHIRRATRSRRLRRTLRSWTAPLVAVGAAAIVAMTVWPPDALDHNVLGYVQCEAEGPELGVRRSGPDSQIVETAACQASHNGARANALSARSIASEAFSNELPDERRPPSADLVDGFIRIPAACHEPPHIEAGVRPVIEGEGC